MTNANRAYRWETNNDDVSKEREQLEAALRRFLENSPLDANERLFREYKELIERALSERKKEKTQENLAVL